MQDKVHYTCFVVRGGQNKNLKIITHDILHKMWAAGYRDPEILL